MYFSVKALSILICLGIFLTFLLIRRKSRESEEAKKKLIGNISHQIKTPITSLTIALAMLDRSGYDAELIHIANKDVERLRNLIDSLLETSIGGKQQ